MSRQDMRWYRLRFPRDVSEAAVLAALAPLSGLSHRARVVLELAGSSDGIIHRLAITPGTRDIVLAGLRAAIPSIRTDAISAPSNCSARPTLWQLNAPVGAIRAEDSKSVTAALLSGLSSLEPGEHVSLRWHVRTAPRPSLRPSAESSRDGRLRALRTKLALPGLNAFGELHIGAPNLDRRRQLRQQVATVLRSLATPFGRLASDTPWWGHLNFWLLRRGRFMSTHELAMLIGWTVEELDLPGLALGSSKQLAASAALSETGRVLGQSQGLGASRPVALTPTASTRGLYIIGPTGTGKTSLLKNLIHDDLEAGLGMVVLETNGDLIADIVDMVPKHRQRDLVLLDAADPEYAVGFNPFADAASPSLVADHIGELFQRLWQAFWGPRTGQLAHMGLLTLARRPGSTLLDLPRLYLDPRFRTDVLADLDDPVGLEPDWQWFQNLPDKEQSAVVAPLLNKSRQFVARPEIRAIVGQAQPRISLSQIVAEQKVLLVNLPKGLLGAETTQLLGCLILTSLWQTATARVGIPLDQRTPFALYVDEVQDFTSAPIPWGEMFAQGRKYGLALTVAHQNLDQIPKDLREVILANARSKAVFALSPHDARILERVFAPALTAADLQSLDAYNVAALLALDDGGTARPVTLQTPKPPASTNSRTAVFERSRQQFACPRADIEQELRRQRQRPSLPPPTAVGRQPRRRS